MGGEKEKWEVRNGWWAEQKQCRHLHGQNFEINERVGCDQHMAEPRAIIYSLKKNPKNFINFQKEECAQDRQYSREKGSCWPHNIQAAYTGKS